MRIKTGDLVQIIAGKEENKGKQGKVLKVLRKENRVVVEDVNKVTKHLRPTNANPEGGTQVIEAPIHVSNVMLVDPKTKKPTRVGIEIKDGKKVRVTKKSGSVLDK
ncbi:large subunit ribosomal protein L24 [Bacilli bacterium PM5-3]|nr:large subunit ribosomal protein L24 [Bacilli bacterium PM5-3]MDH6604195.1 large subunit ribosomal protein L24 [Bacilli bacterium PM5-9]